MRAEPRDEVTHGKIPKKQVEKPRIPKPMWEASEQEERGKSSERAISGGQQEQVPDCRERDACVEKK